MPRVNVNVLVYLTSFLRTLIENGWNFNDASKYCALFSCSFHFTNVTNSVVTFFESRIISRPKVPDSRREKNARKEFILELVFAEK